MWITDSAAQTEIEHAAINCLWMKSVPFIERLDSVVLLVKYEDQVKDFGLSESIICTKLQPGHLDR